MRLESTKRHKYKPTEAQKVAFHGAHRGRQRATMKDFTREGAYALKARLRDPLEGFKPPWRWYGPSGHFVDHWFMRGLLPETKARSIAEELRQFGRQEVKIVKVWRTVKG